MHPYPHKPFEKDIELRILALLLGLVFSSATAASAHEYYLLPQDFTPAAGTSVNVEHRLGQKFNGNQMPWVTLWNIRSEMWQDGQSTPVKGIDGDRPALKISPDKSKLTTIIHQSNIDFLTFSTWEKFVSYTNKEGLAYAQQASNDGTKPKEKLREAYARYAKTLITPAGSAEGNDISTGLKIELIALKNPMSLSKSDPMPIQLLFDGKPLSGANLKVFVGIDTEVAHRIITDAQGKANVPAEGAGPYLLNAIHMTEPQSEEAKSKNAHWESFWASLTFKRAQ